MISAQVYFHVTHKIKDISEKILFETSNLHSKKSKYEGQGPLRSTKDWQKCKVYGIQKKHKFNAKDKVPKSVTLLKTIYITFLQT